MRTAVLIFTLVFWMLSMAPNLQGAQLLKFGELIEHYEQHQSSNESFGSFLSFVQDHYFNNLHHGKNEGHMPFKSTISGAYVLHIQENKIDSISVSVENIEKASHYFGEPNGSLDDPTISVWNPPRMV